MQRKDNLATIKQQISDIIELKRKGVSVKSLAKRYEVSYWFMRDLIATALPEELARRQDDYYRSTVHCS